MFDQSKNEKEGSKSNRMNSTNFEHMAITTAIQFVFSFVAIGIVLLFGYKVACIVLVACIGPAVFFGREHRDSERRLMKYQNTSTLTRAITIQSLKFWQWTVDGFLDFALPVLAAVIMAVVQLVLL